MNFSKAYIKELKDQKITIILKGGQRIEGIVERSDGKVLHIIEKAPNPTYACAWKILISEIAAIGIETQITK